MGALRTGDDFYLKNSKSKNLLAGGHTTFCTWSVSVVSRLVVVGVARAGHRAPKIRVAALISSTLIPAQPHTKSIDIAVPGRWAVICPNPRGASEMRLTHIVVLALKMLLTAFTVSRVCACGSSAGSTYCASGLQARGRTVRQPSFKVVAPQTDPLLRSSRILERVACMVS